MNELINGDCIEEMAKLASGSVDAIICDPPYGTMNGFNGIGWDFIISPDDIFDMANRVLKTNSRLVLFSQEPFTSLLISSQRWYLPFNYRMAWVKDTFANALLCNKAPVGFFEDIVVFTKIESNEATPTQRYLNSELEASGKAKDCLKPELSNDVIGHTFTKPNRFRVPTASTYSAIQRTFEGSFLMGYDSFKQLDSPSVATFNLAPEAKYKSNVLEYRKDYRGEHPTQKPVALMEDLVITYTNVGETVLDFTMGSGTTGVACRNLNRNFIGIERDPAYFAIAKERIESVNEQQQELL